VDGALDELGGKLRKLADRALEPGERVLFCIPGTRGQALVALDRRLLVVKAGAPAGRAFGGIAASHRYADITEISLTVGEVNSVIRISGPRPRTREWWQWSASHDDPLRAPDALLLPSSAVDACRPYVERLRELVAEARSEGAPVLVAELERLAALHASGALSDEEFARAKRALLP
jgi:hypothetical protein